ncbi:dienelactone hydrolase family protein [Shewanella denitrificans OS217]|uniref:Dienelactone hydrolase family protein n=1 Tax=Shewanella denitrificans (strain OS217 / ATCC BAA-1090 / DSM 15013) TaxID=318161 RepID=Q12L95_SHEDO|nr:acyl-CoA thioester hydrolase/BAAT C-terminal domain-containing protein [Shewanella denitrificans]ABE55781.1 dienelactone hydrolase family protein [Shewanella denitrificans OS217]
MLRKSLILVLTGALTGLFSSISQGAETLSVATDAIAADFYPATQAGPQYGVLVLGGAEGGKPESLAKAIAHEGHPVLSLAYFNDKGLPQELEQIPLEYFAKAKVWLLNQANVRQDGLILVGWSKGAELSLLLASQDPLFSKVVAIAPSSVIWAGFLKDWTKTPSSSWTQGGKALDFVPFRPTGEVKGLLDLYSQSLQNAKAGQGRIPVENIKGDVVLLTGSNDEIWPSNLMAKALCQRMDTAGTQGSCTHINFEGLDHLLGEKFLDSNDAMHKQFMGFLEAE